MVGVLNMKKSQTTDTVNHQLMDRRKSASQREVLLRKKETSPPPKINRGCFFIVTFIVTMSTTQMEREIQGWPVESVVNH